MYSRRLEEAILDTPGCNFAKRKGVPPKPARLPNATKSTWLRTLRCWLPMTGDDTDLVLVLPSLGLRRSASRVSTFSKHPGFNMARQYRRRQDWRQ